MKNVSLLLVVALLFSHSIFAQNKPKLDPQYFNNKTLTGKLGMITVAMQKDKQAAKVDWSDEYRSKVIVFYVGKTKYSFQSNLLSYGEPVLINIQRTDMSGRITNWDITDSGKVIEISYQRGSLNLSEEGECIETKPGECMTRPMSTTHKKFFYVWKKHIPNYQKECFAFISKRYGYKL